VVFVPSADVGDKVTVHIKAVQQRFEIADVITE